MEYRQLAEKSPTSILVIRNGNILYTNPAFSVFSGYNDAEIIGKNLLSFVNPSDHEEFTKFTKRCTN
ncbi:MAG: PAS domain-containing protein, partial [Methanoregula sp.]|nr:PAS domain-containing protein [Methanoregula sp.]